MIGVPARRTTFGAVVCGAVLVAGFFVGRTCWAWCCARSCCSCGRAAGGGRRGVVVLEPPAEARRCAGRWSARATGQTARAPPLRAQGAEYLPGEVIKTMPGVLPPDLERARIRDVAAARCPHALNGAGANDLEEPTDRLRHPSQRAECCRAALAAAAQTSPKRRLARLFCSQSSFSGSRRRRARAARKRCERAGGGCGLLREQAACGQRAGRWRPQIGQRYVAGLRFARDAPPTMMPTELTCARAGCPGFGGVLTNTLVTKACHRAGASSRHPPVRRRWPRGARGRRIRVSDQPTGARWRGAATCARSRSTRAAFMS